MANENLPDKPRIDLTGLNHEEEPESLDLEGLRSIIRQDENNDSIYVPELDDGHQPESSFDAGRITASGEPDSEQSSTSKKENRRRGFPFRTAAIFLAAAAVVGYGIYRMVSAAPKTADRNILRNVYVAGVNVGGMYRTQAMNAVEAELNLTLYTLPMEVQLPGETLELFPEDTAIKLDTQAAVEAAFDYGHNGYLAKEQAEASKRGEAYYVDIIPYLSVNQDFIRAMLKAATDSLVGEYQASGYSLEGNAPLLDPAHFDISSPCQTLVLNKGIPGTGVDPNILFEKVMAAYNSGKTTVDASSPDTQRIPDALDLDFIYRILTVSPTDAQVDNSTLSVIPGSYGYGFDLENARTALEQAEYGEDIRIPMHFTFPNISRGNTYFQDELGSAEISCDVSTLPNVFIACDSINCRIVKPHERFSMSNALSTRFTPVNCQNVPVEDDGFCMVASALYQSALKAELNTENINHHNYLPSYCEKGTDVCVNAYNSVQFTNPTDSPVMILTEITANGFRVRIMGTETRSYSTALTAETTQERDFSSMTQTVEPNSGYTDGQIIQTGIKPCTVVLKRLTVDRQTGETLSSNVIRTINYLGLNEIVASVQ